MSRQIATIVLALGLASRAAQAEPSDQAKPHIEAAMKAHASGDFAGALAELTEAYRLDPQPELLFALGQVYGKLDRCADAIDAYQKFLVTAKDAETTQITQQAIDACKQTLATRAPPPPPTLLSPAPPAPPAHPAFYTDALGDALVLGGVAAGVVGGILYASARSQLDDAEAAPTLVDYQAHVDSAHARRLGAVVLVGGGVALVTAGLVRFALHRSSDEHASTVSLVPSSSGGMVVWAGGW